MSQKLNLKTVVKILWTVIPKKRWWCWITGRHKWIEANPKGIYIVNTEKMQNIDGTEIKAEDRILVDTTCDIICKRCKINYKDIMANPDYCRVAQGNHHWKKQEVVYSIFEGTVMATVCSSCKTIKRNSIVFRESSGSTIPELKAKWEEHQCQK